MDLWLLLLIVLLSIKKVSHPYEIQNTFVIIAEGGPIFN